MAGRGREATLPAWMTGGMPGAPGAPGAPAAPGSIGGPIPGPAGMPGAMYPPPPVGSAPAMPYPPAPGQASAAPQGMPPGPPPFMGGPAPLSFPGLPPPPFQGMPPGGYGMAAPSGYPPAPFLPPAGMLPPPGMRPPVPAAPPAAAQVVAASAPTAPKSDWTEHTSPDGRKYYFNKVTKKSSWEKPEDLMNEAEKSDAGGSAWKEFTAPDGRKYYYNRTTKESRWTVPDELKKGGEDGAKKPTVQVVALSATPEAAKAPAPATRASESGAADGAKPVVGEPNNNSKGGRETSVDPSGSAGGGKSYDFSNKAEAKEAFKELLASAGVGSDWTWDQTMRAIVNDPRYGALKTLGEKKAAFNEYLQAKRNEEREEERRRVRVAREDFVRMLVDSPALKSSHAFRRARELFEEEPWWRAVLERDREELFHEAQIEKRAKEKEEARAEKKRRMSAFRDLLERTHGIKVTSEWRKVGPKLEGEPEYEALDKLERLEGFKEYIDDLERQEREAAEAAREAVRRAERKAREAFKDLLAAHRAEGRITIRTRWKEYAASIKGHEAFTAVERNTAGSRPKELFEDVMEDLEAEYDKAKGLLRELARDVPELVVGHATAFDAWVAALEEKGGERAAKVDAALRQAYFEEVQAKAKAREEEEAARRVRARERLASFLRHARDLTPGTTWEDFLATHGKEREVKEVDAEVAHEMFDAAVARLAEKVAAREAEKAAAKEAEKAARDMAHGSSDEGGGGGEGRREGRHKDGKKSKKSKSSRKHDRGSDDEESERKSKKKHKHKDKDSEHKDRDREKDKDAGRGREQQGGGGEGPTPSGSAPPPAGGDVPMTDAVPVPDAS